MSSPIAQLYTSAGALFLASSTSVPANIATTLGASLAANGSAGTYVGSELWVLTSTTAIWVAQGSAPTASVGAGSVLVPANFPVLIDGSNGSHLSVLADTTAGHVSLARCYLR